MIRYIYILLLILIYPSLGSAKEAWRGFCEEGAQHVITSGLSSTTQVQQSHPSCLVTIYVHGGGLAVIYSDNNGTPLANPFTANVNGQFTWYAANGRYDQTTTAAGFSQTTTYSDILLCDPADTASACGTAAPGAAAVSIFKNNVLVGIEPGIDFVEGTGITITPTSDDPANLRVHLTFNATGGSSGCTLPGTDTGVLSEHPVGTCYDNNHFTWNDGTSKQVLTIGDGTNTNGTQSQLQINFGSGSAVCTTVGATCFDLVSLGTAANLEGATGLSGDDVYDIFNFGPNNKVINSGKIALLGDHHIITGDTNVTDNVFRVYMRGDHDTLTVAGASGGANEIFVDGFSQTLTGTTGGTINNTFLLGHSNTATFSGTANVADSILGGISNAISSSGSGSFTSSIYTWSESFSVSSSSGGHVHDIYGMGLSGNYSAAGASSTLDDIGYLGFSNQAHSNNAFEVQKVIEIGNLNAVSSTASGVANVGTYGKSNTIVDCSDCYLFGENGSFTSSNSSTVGIGFSAQPELTIKSNQITHRPTAFASLPTCAAGTEGTLMAVNDANQNTWGTTITAGSSTNHVLAFCDGTNWTVAGK